MVICETFRRIQNIIWWMSCHRWGGGVGSTGGQSLWIF